MTRRTQRLILSQFSRRAGLRDVDSTTRRQRTSSRQMFNICLRWKSGSYSRHAMTRGTVASTSAHVGPRTYQLCKMIMIDFTMMKELGHQQHLRVVRYYCEINQNQVTSIKHKRRQLNCSRPSPCLRRHHEHDTSV